MFGYDAAKATEMRSRGQGRKTGMIFRPMAPYPLRQNPGKAVGCLVNSRACLNLGDGKDDIGQVAQP